MNPSLSGGRRFSAWQAIGNIQCRLDRSEGWFAQAPENASWTEIYGVSVLCGIGFTMSLFIGLLASQVTKQ